MHGVGRAARSASRLIAKADTGTKNDALHAIAHRIERTAKALLSANACDVEAARKAARAIDRLTLTRTA